MKNSLIIFIVAVLLVGAGLFYWYEYRPSQIRKECNMSGSTGFGLKGLGSVASEENYQSCMRSHGLEK